MNATRLGLLQNEPLVRLQDLFVSARRIQLILQA